MEKHNEDVARIASEVRKFHDRKESFRIYHGSSNSTRQSTREKDRIVDTSALNRVINIDVDRKRATVEPKVRMDQLAEATLAKGLLPPIVMEFPAITAGGGFAGMAGESSSFKYGFFDSIVLSIEIVLADGTVVVASDSERSDLFYGSARTCGTLGIITLLEIQLIEAKPFVELTYHPVAGVKPAVELCQSLANNADKVDYVDGIIYSKNKAVIVSGRLADSATKGAKVRRFTRARDQWFYIHADKVTREKTAPVTELVPIVDYLFRFDRGAFWAGLVPFNYFRAPFDRFSRFVLDPLLHTETMYRALHYSELDKKNYIQDFALPFSVGEDFIEYINQTVDIFPLWLCPIKAPSVQSSVIYNHPFPESMLLNVGIWGQGPKDYDQFVELHRKIEHQVHSLHGIKWPYAHAYWTESEFWEVHNRQAYDELRVKYGAESLPSIYEKLKAPARTEPGSAVRSKMVRRFWHVQPIPGLYGLVKTVVGRDYLLRKST